MKMLVVALMGLCSVASAELPAGSELDQSAVYFRGDGCFKAGRMYSEYQSHGQHDVLLVMFEVFPEREGNTSIRVALRNDYAGEWEARTFYSQDDIRLEYGPLWTTVKFQPIERSFVVIEYHPRNK